MEPAVESTRLSPDDYISLSYDALDVSSAIEKAKDCKCGAVSLFIGITRDHFEEKMVISLEYEAYVEMATDSLKNIIAEIRRRWNVSRVVIEHKLGSCPVGEISVVIAISSVHRRESLDAVDWCIDELKRTVPIWKKECYSNGECTWKENVEAQSG